MQSKFTFIKPHSISKHKTKTNNNNLALVQVTFLCAEKQ